MTGLLLPVIVNNLLAVLISPVKVGLILLSRLVLQELLDSCLLQLLRIQGFLDFELVDLHFTISSLPLFTGKLVVVLGFLDLVHGGSV